MNRLLVLAILFVCRAANAEIIDRVAVIIDKTAIALSEIDRQIRLTAFMNGEPPDFSSDARRDAADRLVEQALIRREMRVAGYSQLESESEQPSPEDWVPKRYPSEAAYRAALARYGLSDKEVRTQMAWQNSLIRFVDLRFRPGIQIPQQEVRAYYRQNFAGKPNAPSYEESRDKIEDLLASERADHALDRWLSTTRAQTKIKYNEAAFEERPKPPAGAKGGAPSAGQETRP